MTDTATGLTIDRIQTMATAISVVNDIAEQVHAELTAVNPMGETPVEFGVIRQMDAISRSILDISVRLVALTMLIGGDQ